MLELFYDNKEDIPEGYAALYTEKEGKWHLTGVKGMKTEADVQRLNTALAAARNDTKAAKALAARFENMDPDQLAADQEELEQLREQQAAGGVTKADAAKIADLVAKGIQRETAKFQRDLAKANKERDDALNQVGELTTREKTSRIKATMATVATEMKVRGEALEDVQMYAERLFEVDEGGNVVARDGVGIEPGLTPKEWLERQQQTRAHWWPESNGGGGKGSRQSGETNPWASGSWDVQAQGDYVKKNGVDKAKQMAESVGSKLGATKPPVQQR